MRYVCANECFWQGRLWKRYAVYEGPKVPPPHFVPESQAPVEKVKFDPEPRSLGEARDRIFD